MSEDIRYRQHRYLLMMGIRTGLLRVALLLFVNHLGWLALIPAVGAIIIPYIAVVFANGGREPDNVRGFLEHRHESFTARPGGSSERRLPKIRLRYREYGAADAREYGRAREMRWH